MKNKVFKVILILVIIIFLISYIIEKTGYYEYKLRERTVLTEESIKKFEEDVKSGKDIDIDEYVVENTLDYGNSLTKSTIKVTDTINSYVKKSIVTVFKLVNKMIEEE